MATSEQVRSRPSSWILALAAIPALFVFGALLGHSISALSSIPEEDDPLVVAAGNPLPDNVKKALESAALSLHGNDPEERSSIERKTEELAAAPLEELTEEPLDSWTPPPGSPVLLLPESAWWFYAPTFERLVGRLRDPEAPSRYFNLTDEQFLEAWNTPGEPGEMGFAEAWGHRQEALALSTFVGRYQRDQDETGGASPPLLSLLQPVQGFIWTFRDPLEVLEAIGRYDEALFADVHEMGPTRSSSADAEQVWPLSVLLSMRAIEQTRIVDETLERMVEK